jgi:hypothetical protein
MDGLSFSSWIILILGFVICFGGAFYCLLIIWGKEPERFLESIGISKVLYSSGDALVDAGIYKPFEYMERGPKEKGIGIVVVLVILIIGWGLGAFDTESESIYTDIDYDVELKNGTLDSISDYNVENTEETFNITVEEQAIATITFTLSWDDEEPTPGFGNDPDEFSLHVLTSWGEYNETPMTANDDSGHGEISLTFRAPGEYPNTGSAGNYTVTVEMGEAGDEWPLGIPSAGFNDQGNEWTLSMAYEYWELSYTE